MITILLFFVYCYGLGFTVSSFVKNSENFLERNLMRLGFGLSLLPFLAIVLNIIKIPADWRIILVISIAYPIYYVFKNYSKFDFSKFTKIRITKTNLSIFAMLIIFFVNFYIYGSGAFNYPYLEDDDSWAHTFGVKYISMNNNAFSQPAAEYVRYINPYPPAYDILLGILHQTNDSVYWTMKFFNALIISLSTIFFYFFVKEFTGNKNKALFAAFALMSIPAFMSHFIWSISLTVPLYFVFFYAIERIKHDRKWWIISGLVMVTVIISSPTHSTYFGLFVGLYYLTKAFLEKKLLVYHALAVIFGVGISFIFWWIPMIMKHGFFGTLKGLGIAVERGASALSVGGTADRVYTFKDFFFAQKQNMINNPIGIGIFLSILTIIGLVYIFLKFKHLFKKENHWIVITFVWFILTFYAVNAVKMTIKISPFRAWMLLAIPVCILAAEGAFNLMSISKKSIGKTGMYAVLLILLTGIYFTSTQQKIAVNTATWPPGAFWTSGEEIGAYIWMKDNLPKNSHAFTYWNNGPIIGMDMFSCHWCPDIRRYMKTGFNENTQDTYNWLKSHDYAYIIIDGQTVREFGIEQVNQKVNGFAESGLFQPVFQNQGAVIFRIA
ncbi:hypothetical protein JYT91_00345 [archaeon AH-315-M20]|nr:hypothetical protein [archaeon AH-315-M20]